MSAASPAQIATVFRCLCPSAGTIVAVASVPGAYDNEVWRIDAEGGHFAVRIPRLASRRARLANAITAQRLATSVGVPAPRVVAFDDGALLGRPLSIQEWLPGLDAESVSGFGRAVGTLHAVSGPHFSDDVTLSRVVPSWPEGLRTYLARYVARLRREALVPRSVLAAAQDRLEVGIARLSTEIRPALTHWDLWLAQALVDGGRFVGLLDWESAAFSDPLADFVRLEVWVFDPHPETREPFYAAYRAIAPLPADADQRLHLYRGLEYLVEIWRKSEECQPEVAADYRARLDCWLSLSG